MPYAVDMSLLSSLMTGKSMEMAPPAWATASLSHSLCESTGSTDSAAILQFISFSSAYFCARLVISVVQTVVCKVRNRCQKVSSSDLSVQKLRTSTNQTFLRKSWIGITSFLVLGAERTWGKVCWVAEQNGPLSLRPLVKASHRTSTERLVVEDNKPTKHLQEVHTLLPTYPWVV